MELVELKTRLGIPVDDSSQDDSLKIALSDAIEYAKDWCGTLFENESGELLIPSPVKKGIALMIEIDLTVPVGAVSDSLAGAIQTFTSDSQRYTPVYRLWKPYNTKVGFF
ncbi:hypothetical protein CW306_03265 [Bacillus sp. BA3]|uniref:phage head-tail connector protein n=1 Tax=Bacillus sp. BA3 TaxID=2057910 RepID=UPI000C32A052|nr:phage head-tail connector protein [Bacillus sp. BA3]PKF90538.1 hypothetical protein CW306_03265 [Bacillus sp. BA3]